MVVVVVGLDYLRLKPTQPKLRLGLGLSLAKIGKIDHHFRSSTETLETRQRKKLTEAKSWYRERKLSDNSQESINTQKPMQGTGKCGRGFTG